MKSYSFQCALLAVLNAVSGLQPDHCGVDLLQMPIGVQDVATVILEGTATLTYTVFEKELGPPPPELEIVIEPRRNVSFKAPDSMPIAPSPSTPPVPSTSSSASTGISWGPTSSPTLIANITRVLLEFIYSPDGPECSITPDGSSDGRRKRYVSPTASPLNIRLLFETLSKALNVTISTLQYNKFSSAIIEIAEGYLKACKTSNPTSATIYTLYDQLIKVRQSKALNKPNLLRNILAKTLCSHSINKRKRSTDPTAADFFREITDFDAENIFGFNFMAWEALGGFPTLAFVVDTTGSMSHAIAGVRETIKSIIALEQQNPFFYVLTPFNDYDDERYVPEYSHLPNYGPNYIATTRSDFGNPYQELKDLYSAVSSLTAHSGGDTPEYCMGGILEALRASRTVHGAKLNLYAEGSQMIVITDAPAKDHHLQKEVEDRVKGTGVKVHFVLVNWYMDYNSLYQSIANVNRGLVVTSTFELSSVIKTLTMFAFQLTGNTPVINDTLLKYPKKRSVENCNSFGVSLFTSQISVISFQSISLTYPNGTTTQMLGPNFFTVKSPDAGRWAVCSTGEMSYSTQKADMRYVVAFLDSNFSIPEYFPTACTKGMVAVTILDDNAKFISPDAWIGLELLNPDNVLLTTVSLVNCSGTYLGNITYPEGIMTSLRLIGRDYLGYEFQYQRSTSSQSAFPAHPCRSLTLAPRQSSSVVVASGESRIFTFSLLVTARTTPVEVRISTLSHSNRISSLVLTNGSVISLEAIAIILVNVTASMSTSGTTTVSFTVQAQCGCNVNDAYEQVFQISSGKSTPTDQCGGCLNGGTCVYLFRRYFCSCPPSFFGMFCQTMN